MHSQMARNMTEQMHGLLVRIFLNQPAWLYEITGGSVMIYLKHPQNPTTPGYSPGVMKPALRT